MEIQGLSKLQMEMADLLWELQTTSEVENFINKLPNTLRADGYVALNMIVAAALDEAPMSDLSLANSVIKSVK